jgi:hypothetical protein
VLRTLVPLAACLLLACGTRAPNEPPEIHAVNGARFVSAGDSAEYTCAASDPEGQDLTFRWVSTRDTLRWNWGDRVRWVAPDSADTARLTVTVIDESLFATEESIKVVVLRDTVDILWWDGAVRGGTYREWPCSLRVNHTIAGRSRTVADSIGDVYFAILDEANFGNWTAGEPSVALFRRLAYRADSFAVVVPATGRYHIVVDNTERAGDYNYWLWVFRISR